MAKKWRCVQAESNRFIKDKIYECIREDNDYVVLDEYNMPIPITEMSSRFEKVKEEAKYWKCIKWGGDLFVVGRIYKENENNEIIGELDVINANLKPAEYTDRFVQVKDFELEEETIEPPDDDSLEEVCLIIFF